VTQDTKGGRPGVQLFVFRLTEVARSANSKHVVAFPRIFELLEQRGFAMMEGIDSDPVSNLVRRIESAE
jgi:hypothetical protein